MKILGISTSNHWKAEETDPNPSKSYKTLRLILDEFKSLGHEVKLIDASKLHIVENQGCYSTNPEGCASKDAGKYRCWAHYNSVKEPEKYGGVDEMPVIYDAIEQADIVLFATPVRWFSHSAVLQRVIERLNTFENRKTVYNEESPCLNKKCGIIVIGHNYKADEVCSHLAEVFRWFDFIVPNEGQFYWTGSSDINSEDTGVDRSNYEDFLKSDEGKMRIKRFLESFSKKNTIYNSLKLKVLKQ
jgi:multimeric flavodoxin WrbA